MSTLPCILPPVVVLYLVPKHPSIITQGRIAVDGVIHTHIATIATTDWMCGILDVQAEIDDNRQLDMDVRLVSHLGRSLLNMPSVTSTDVSCFPSPLNA